MTFPVRSAEPTSPPETDATAGLPFRFDVPAAVGPDPVPGGILRGSVSRHRATVHVPGMRQVVAGNTPPVGRFRTLVASAPTGGTAFRAAVAVPAEAPRRKGRLP